MATPRTRATAAADDFPLEPVSVDRLQLGVIEIDIAGVTPLIVHRFDEKAKEMLLENQQNKKRAGREKKDPEKDFERSRHQMPDGRDGFPAVAFKAAMVNAASHFPRLTKVMLKQSLFIEGQGPEQLVAIDGDPTLREDAVRVGMGVADLRYRAQYWPWSAHLTVRFIMSSITAQTVVALLDAGGLGGVGEWRPSAPKSYTGSFGRFEVVGHA